MKSPGFSTIGDSNPSAAYHWNFIPESFLRIDWSTGIQSVGGGDDDDADDDPRYQPFDFTQFSPELLRIIRENPLYLTSRCSGRDALEMGSINFICNRYWDQLYREYIAFKCSDGSGGDGMMGIGLWAARYFMNADLDYNGLKIKLK